MAVSSSLGPTDGYLAIAVQEWGNEYYVITHDEGRSQVAITASEAMTSVLVTLPPGCVLVMDEVEVMAPEYVNVTLDQFEVLLLQADTDLTGTYIQADKPVGVVSGNRFIGGRTHLVEQPLPIKTWGRNYVSAPNSDSHWGPVDTYRIISSLYDTNILVGNRSYNIEVSGAWLDVNIGTLVKIVSDKPVMVMKFSSSSISGTPTCMAVLVPEEQWRSRYTFITPLAFNKHWVTIVAHTDKVQSIILDANPIQAQWSSVPGTNISVGVREVSEGSHYLDGSGNHAVYLSGAGNGLAAYCYPAGMGVDTINTKNLSTYKRKHTSAPDPRVSARALGTFGVVILISAVCILIAIDLPVLCHDVINLAPSKRPRMDRRIR
ncbi:IgGFc-binding protein-like [Haliotis cracherodii]|uniref:IgGFc-binding protein-like n=1 Tax=Haliotis cracherodii TaxID=6455 RepID=UPI0039EC4DA5